MDDQFNKSYVTPSSTKIKEAWLVEENKCASGHNFS